MDNRLFQSRPNNRVLIISVCVVLFAVSLAAGQKKGGPAPCPKPSVAPPETSCFFGSGCRDSTFNGTGFTVYEQLGRIHSVMTTTINDELKIITVGDGSRSTTSPTGTDVVIMRFNADGSRDTSFGEVDVSNPIIRTGQTYIPVTAGTEFVNAGALQPDGKILAGGWSNGIWWVVRTSEDGSPDPSFDGDGIRTVVYSDGGAQDLLVQLDGKIVVGGGPNFTITRFNIDGSLDGSFGTGGKVTVNASSGTGSSRLWSLALQRVPTSPNEDQIVVGGWSTAKTNGVTSFAVMRLRSNGSVDTSFGTNGKVNTSFFGTGDQVRELRIDPSNKIVAAGITRINSCSATDFGIARYTENGQLDPSFGSQGKASLDLYNDENSVYALTVQPDGKPIVGGNARVLATDAVNRRYYFTIVRFDTAGNRDATFGPGNAGPGVVTTAITGASQSSFIFSLHQQPDGRILAAGTSIEKPTIARYLQ